MGMRIEHRKSGSASRREQGQDQLVEQLYQQIV
jgi:hypothetical protein